MVASRAKSWLKTVKPGGRDMRRLLVAVFIMVTGPAAAEPVSGREAGRLLFDAGQSRVIVSSRLDERGQQMVRLMVPLMEQQLGRKLEYYGAIAMSPDEGFQSEASQSALNYHGVAAADAAALSACNATRALRDTYARARAPKALAASASTGAFAVGRPDEALAACQRGARGGGDCAIVVRD